MEEECLICRQPLEYLEEDVLMECAVCHKKESSKTRCIQGHYVCSECHTQGMDSIIGLCLHEHSKNPIKIIDKMMAMPFCHMHGPEHHVMVGAALLTAYHNAGGKGGALEGSAGDVPPRKRGSRRSLWFLGSLRSRDQYGDVSVDCYKIHSSGRKRMGTVQSDDSKGASKDW